MLTLEDYTGASTEPPAGTLRALLPLGSASALVEYRVNQYSDIGANSGERGTGIIIDAVLINGLWCKPLDVVAGKILSRWVENLLEARKS